MIKGAIFDMDGTLVANSPVHIRAFEIFCDRYGVRGWKEKLGGCGFALTVTKIQMFQRVGGWCEPIQRF